MIDQELQVAIQQEVQKQLTAAKRFNANGILFDQNTGMATQGQNVYGLFGDRVIHDIIRFNLTDQTIASGKIMCSSGSILVDTESSAASDDLDTINVGTLVKGEEIIMLRAKDDTHTVVVKHNTGNIFLAGAADFSLDSKYDILILRYDLLLSKFVEVLRTNVA